MEMNDLQNKTAVSRYDNFEATYPTTKAFVFWSALVLETRRGNTLDFGPIDVAFAVFWCCCCQRENTYNSDSNELVNRKDYC